MWNGIAIVSLFFSPEILYRGCANLLHIHIYICLYAYTYIYAHACAHLVISLARVAFAVGPTGMTEAIAFLVL